MKKSAETSTAMFRVYSAKSLLSLAAAILEGEMARQRGDLPAAIKLFEQAAALDDGLAYDEPEALPFDARHWLGAALLEAGHHNAAERVYREELVDHPHNGWSLLGLQKALAAQGNASKDVDDDLAASWSRSDTWIRASRF